MMTDFLKDPISVKKVHISVSLLVFSVGIFSLYAEMPVITVSTVSMLVLLTLIRSSWSPAILLSILLTFLFPSIKFDRLYGSDSHTTAAYAVKIGEFGWPLPERELLLGGFPHTPLMHLHAIIGSQITGLNLFPSNSGGFLITAILPIFYTLIAIFFAALIAQKSKLKVTADIPDPYMIIPALLYTPFVSFHTGFRRESLGITLFIIIAYLIHRCIYAVNRRYILIILVLSILIPFAHHFSALVLTAFTFIVFFTILIKQQLIVGGDSKINQLWPLIVVQGISFTSLYFIFGQGGRRFVSIVAGISAVRFDDILSYIGFGSVSSSPFFPYTISRSFTYIFKSFLSKWIYMFFIGLGIVAIIFVKYNKTEVSVDEISTISFYFGVLVGVASFFGWVTSTIPWDRLFSFFVLSFAWLAPAGIKAVSERRFDSNASSYFTAVFVSILLIIGLGMIPHYTISKESPNYNDGELTQQFDRSQYVGSQFVADYVPRTQIVGDAIALELLGSRGYRVNGHHSTVLTGNLSEINYAFIGDWNKDIYRAKDLQRGWISLNPPRGIFNRLNVHNHRIYSNGNITVYNRRI